MEHQEEVPIRLGRDHLSQIFDQVWVTFKPYLILALSTRVFIA